MASATFESPAAPAKVDRSSRVLFTATILVSSFLLFLIQPMYARMMLPRVGGAPVVWNAALVFFQAVLLLGYGYAHVASKRAGPRRHAKWHWAVLLLPLPFLPLMLRALPGIEATAQPVVWLLGTLALGVGVPYAVVATTSPLVQRWFATTADPNADDPYFLYAASNIGSFAALLVYPLVMEPRMTLTDQGRLWAGLYALMVVLMVLCSRRVGARHEDLDDTPRTAIPPKELFGWGFLAFVPSCLMVATTTYLTTAVVSAPMLWVVPLGLYLLTFVFAFAKRQIVPDWLLTIAAASCTVLVVVANYSGQSVNGGLKLGLNVLALFLVGWMVHRRLAARRPGHEHLTGFYFTMSVGGVLGGLFAGLLSPVIFTRVLEYPFSFALAAVAVFPLLKRRSWWDLAWGLLAAGVYFAAWKISESNPAWTGRERSLIVWIPLCLFVLAGVVRPVRFFGGMVVLVIVALIYDDKINQPVVQSRSYFGTLTVVEDSALQRRSLVHGVTLHGVQSLNPAIRQKPTSYYCEDGPLGDLMNLLPRPADAHMAVVGCGVGTTTAYGKPGQKWTVFEIDPDVRDIAKGDPLFTYISHCPAEVKFAMGDARIKLAESAEKYDMIVLDAYSSDNIPMHLMTVESFRLYMDRLTPHGVLAVHISNRFLDLKQQVALISKELGLAQARRFGYFPPRDPQLRFSSEWMVVAHSLNDIEPLRGHEWQTVQPDPNIRVWTDERSSILDVLHPDWLSRLQ